MVNMRSIRKVDVLLHQTQWFGFAWVLLTAGFTRCSKDKQDGAELYTVSSNTLHGVFGLVILAKNEI